MTKIEELEQRLEVMEKVTKAYGIFKEEVEQLQKALAELKESKKEGKWKPAHGERYFFRDVFAETDFFTYEADNEGDIWRVNNLPVFKSEKECEKYWHFMDIVKEKSYEFNKEEFNNGNTCKYHIAFDHNTNIFFVDCFNFTSLLGATYFKTEADAQYIIDNFKEELLKYWL